MSYLYRGTNSGQTIAIKIMRRSLVNNPEIITRFNREVRISMNLSHPNIVKVFSGGHLSTGEPFLIMEYLEGSTLADILKTQNSIQAMRAFRLIKQAAEALHVAHQKGYVHRDIKPQNLMVVQNLVKGEQVKVLDFGVAKLTGEIEKMDHFATAPGDVLGTPLYLSPEQVLGNPLDGRSDIYALACVLYECLCGVPAIKGTTALEVMQNHLDYMPPHLNYYCKKKLPNEMNDIVQKGLAKVPDERYKNMLEFAEAMQGFSMPMLLSKLLKAAGEFSSTQFSGKGKHSKQKNRVKNRK
jgi:serine/threonine-protein kinase